MNKTQMKEIQNEKSQMKNYKMIKSQIKENPKCTNPK